MPRTKSPHFHLREIIITRGFNPFNERITTGYFNAPRKNYIGILEEDFGVLKDFSAEKQLKNKIIISFWNKNNWKSLVELLRIDKKGEFLYKISQKKLGIDVLMEALNDSNWEISNQAAETMVRLGKADKNVIDALLLAQKDENSYARSRAADSLGILWQNKSDNELIDYLQHPYSEYRIAAAHALAQKKSISPETIEKIDHLKDKDPRPWVRLGAWKAYELLLEKKEPGEGGE